MALAARRLSRDALDPDADRVARAALLHGLGLWGVAADDPDWLAGWFDLTDPEARRDRERRDLGVEVGELGETLARRWGCDPLIADAAWAHSDPDGGLTPATAEPERVARIQEAYLLAAQTPWAPPSPRQGAGRSRETAVKLLTAEVQARCTGAFTCPAATAGEETYARAFARSQARLYEATAALATQDRLLQALGASHPSDPPELWAERAGRAWCGEPGVSAARVAWEGEQADRAGDGREVPADRTPDRELTLGGDGPTLATVRLWAAGPPLAPVPGVLLDAWDAWASLVADRVRLEGRLGRVVRAYRDRLATSEASLRTAKLDALAEFAAGAGHELNNPLAVIVGRAQLLLAQEADPAVAKSLRAILNQGQRAHRILRDLMYVARPPEPRLRSCLPDEIIRACLRDARPLADDREVRLQAGPLEHGVKAWADPDALRHLADTLVRNALESTPKGGLVSVSSAGGADGLRWSVQDSGRGVSADEAAHLLDPFFCGRQAGRGLGMGLPRAARFVTLSGGAIRWQSVPSQGTTFQVDLPLTEPPGPPAAEVRADLGRLAASA